MNVVESGAQLLLSVAWKKGAIQSGLYSVMITSRAGEVMTYVWATGDMNASTLAVVKAGNTWLSQCKNPILSKKRELFHNCPVLITVPFLFFCTKYGYLVII